MNDYELLQAVYAIRAAGGGDGASFFTLLSAYMVVAYLVGDKLSTFQLWTISALYMAYMYFVVAAMHLAASDLVRLDAAPLGAELLTPVLGLMWLVSIVFMMQTRRESRVPQ